MCSSVALGRRTIIMAVRVVRVNFQGGIACFRTTEGVVQYSKPALYSGGGSICTTNCIANSRFSDGGSSSRPSRKMFHPNR